MEYLNSIESIKKKMDAIGKFTNRNNFKISDLTDELKEL
jgi:hypothetical protein